MKKEAKCCIENEKLCILKDSEEVMIQIFNSNGTLYKQFVSDKNDESIQLPERGTYLVVIQSVNKTSAHKIKWE